MKAKNKHKGKRTEVHKLKKKGDLIKSKKRHGYVRRDFHLSHSSMLDFLHCRRAWAYSYIDRLETAQTQAELLRGAVIHKMMQIGLLKMWCRQNKPMAKDFKKKFKKKEGHKLSFEKAIEYMMVEELMLPGRDKQECTEYVSLFMLGSENDDELPESVLETLTSIFEWYEVGVEAYKAFKKKGTWEIYTINGEPAIEYGFTVPVDWNDEVYFSGQVDAIVRDCESDTLWVMDHKSRKTFKDYTTEETNAQFILYQYALAEHVGEYIEGTITYQIKPYLPKIPKVNANGESMSRANIDTTWQVYKEALKVHGFKIKNYAGMKKKLKGKKFHHIIRNFRSPEEMLECWEDYVNTLGPEMYKRYLRPQSRLTRLPTFGYRCHNCQYRAACLNRLRGGADNPNFEIIIEGKK